MQERVKRLKGEITKLKALARSCDKDIAAQMRELACDMEKVTKEMERKLAQADEDAR